MNGRVDVSDSRFSNIPYKLFEEDNDAKRSGDIGGLGNRERTPLSDLFFSKININGLHEAIRYQVYINTDNNYVIDRQSDVDLRVIMHSVYLEHSRNLPYDIVGQVRALNKAVLAQTVAKVITEIDMYMTYRKDISSLPTPMQRSLNVSSAGTKTLETREF